MDSNQQKLQQLQRHGEILEQQNKRSITSKVEIQKRIEKSDALAKETQQLGRQSAEDLSDKERQAVRVRLDEIEAELAILHQEMDLLRQDQERRAKDSEVAQAEYGFLSDDSSS